MSHKSIRLSVLIILSVVSLVWLSAHLWKIFPLTGQFVQRDPDSALFARLLEQSILKGQVLKHDNYSCFPYEIRHGFGPFYLWFLYNATVLHYTFFPGSSLDPMVLAGLLPIVFTWLTTLLIMVALYKTARNPVFFFLSCFFMLPASSVRFNSSYMLLDYDFLISFLIWTWICSYILVTETSSRFWQLAGVLVAVVLTATWSGSPLFFFFATAYGFYVWLTAGKSAQSYLEFASSSMLAGAIVNLLLISHAELGGEMLSLSKYSYFQPVCIALGGISCHLLNVFQARNKSRFYGLLLLVGVSLLLVVIFRHQLLQASGFLLQRDPIHKTISELVPMLQPAKILTNNENLKDVLSFFGFGILFFPLFAFFKWNCMRRDQEQFLYFWVLLMLLLSFYQVRYLRWITVGAGIYYAVCFYVLWRILNREFAGKSRRRLIAVAIFVPLLVLQSFHGFHGNIAVASLSAEQVEAFSWMRRNTPETSGYFDDKRPEYGILSYWDEGNLLAYCARRPAVVNNAMWGYKTMADIFSAKTEDDAYNLCEKYQVRYVFMSTFRTFSRESYNFWPTFKNMPEQPEYILKHTSAFSEDDPESFFYSWLRENLALTSRAGFKVGSHFRLVYAAKSDRQTISPYVLFEKVPGARISLRNMGMTEVEVSLLLKVGEIAFIYKKRLNVKEGEEMTLQYSTSHFGGRIKTDPFYKVAFKQEDGTEKIAKLTVSESDVLNGNNVTDKLEVVSKDSIHFDAD